MGGYIGSQIPSFIADVTSASGDFAVGDDLTVDTNTLYVDSTNNRVGVGTVSPVDVLHVKGEGQITVEDTSSGNIGELYVSNTALQLSADPSGSIASSSIVMRVDGTERMRIDDSGNLLVGTTTAYGRFAVESTGQNNIVSTFPSGSSGTAYYGNVYSTAQFLARWEYRGGNVGSITTNSSSTSYNTSSDYRLKENVTDVTDGITRVKQLEPKRFNFIADPDRTVDGFLAHEAQAVVPEAITGTHNEVDDDGNPVYQGIDQSKLVPLLTAALKESIAKIEALEARVTALEGN